MSHLLGPHAADAQAFLDVNEFARDTGWLHAPMTAFATYGVAVLAAALLAGWWTARSHGPSRVAASVWAGAAGLLAVAANQPLVHHFHEARPYTADPRLLVLAHRSTDYSFPSDHAVLAGAVAAGLWLVSRRLGLVATAAAVVLAFARVYIAAHYVHDVVVGLAVGAAVALIGWWLVRRPLTAAVARLAATRLRPLVRSGG